MSASVWCAQVFFWPSLPCSCPLHWTRKHPADKRTHLSTGETQFASLLNYLQSVQCHFVKGGRLTPPRRSVAKLTPLAFTAFAFWERVGGWDSGVLGTSPSVHTPKWTSLCICVTFPTARQMRQHAKGSPYLGCVGPRFMWKCRRFITWWMNPFGSNIGSSSTSLPWGKKKKYWKKK